MSREDLTEEQRAAMPCLIARCGTCQGIIAAAVAHPEFAKDNAKAVASWVRDGLAVATITSREVREATWCSCKNGKKAKT